MRTASPMTTRMFRVLERRLDDWSRSKNDGHRVESVDDGVELGLDRLYYVQ